MTPHQARPGVGGFKTDRMLGRLGRLCVSSGTQDLDTFADINRLITRLKKERRWELLALLMARPGERALMTPLELFDATWQHKALPTAESILPLHRSVRRWIETLDRSVRTKGGYQDALTSMGHDASRVGDLPELLIAARTRALERDQRPSFNRLLSAAVMFTTQRLGKSHALTLAVANIERLTETPREGNPQSVAQVAALAAKLGRHAPTLWALCLSGLRRDEYFGRRWTLQGDRIDVLGTKSRAARRSAPLIYPIAAPTCGADHFNHLLHELTDGAVRIHDCRYTWMRWLTEAGVAEMHLRWYAGHAVKNVSERYLRARGFPEHVGPDGEKARAWLGDVPATGLRILGRA